MADDVKLCQAVGEDDPPNGDPSSCTSSACTPARSANLVQPAVYPTVKGGMDMSICLCCMETHEYGTAAALLLKSQVIEEH